MLSVCSNGMYIIFYFQSCTTEVYYVCVCVLICGTWGSVPAEVYTCPEIPVPAYAVGHQPRLS